MYTRCMRLTRVWCTHLTANGISWRPVNAAGIACVEMPHGRCEVANACVSHTSELRQDYDCTYPLHGRTRRMHASSVNCPIVSCYFAVFRSAFPEFSISLCWYSSEFLAFAVIIAAASLALTNPSKTLPGHLNCPIPRFFISFVMPVTFRRSCHIWTLRTSHSC